MEQLLIGARGGQAILTDAWGTAEILKARPVVERQLFTVSFGNLAHSWSLAAAGVRAANG
jgi:hypothetical protein